MQSLFKRSWPLLFLVLSGCGFYSVTIDSLARQSANPISYSIRNANPAVPDSAPLFVETANLVRTALSGRGLYEAPPNAEPDVVVSIDYGVSDPHVHREKKLRPSQSSWDDISAGMGKWNRDPTKETEPFSAPIPPTRMEEYTEVRTTYEKYLRLTARERTAKTPDRPPLEIWTVDATSEGESADLQKYLPILAAASIDYVNRDSHGQKKIRLRDKDADVVFVKKGM